MKDNNNLNISITQNHQGNMWASTKVQNLNLMLAL